MATVKELVDLLEKGKGNAQFGDDLEEELM